MVVGGCARYSSNWDIGTLAQDEAPEKNANGEEWGRAGGRFISLTFLFSSYILKALLPPYLVSRHSVLLSLHCDFPQ